MSGVGIVIPTIFSRPEYLPLAVRSIKSAGDCHLLISSPSPTTSQQELLDDLTKEGLVDSFVIETPELSLGEKITEALSKLPEECDVIGWLGDDDLLTFKSLELAAATLRYRPDAVMVFGGVDYIDSTGKVLFTNQSAQWHEKLLRFGPQLIPQPGSLWRRRAFEQVGGLSSEYNLAFDFDLFLKLSKVGRLVHLPQTLAQFRWHPESLSVKRRWVSASEASRVRRSHYSGVMRVLWPLWEPWVILSTWLAGKLVSLRFRASREKAS